MTDTDQRKASQSADTEIAYDSGFLAGKRSQAAEIARLNDEVERLTGLLEQERVLTLADIRHDAEQAERHRALELRVTQAGADVANALECLSKEFNGSGPSGVRAMAIAHMRKAAMRLAQASPAQPRGGRGNAIR